MRRVVHFIALVLSLCGSAHAQTYDFRPVTSYINSFVGADAEDLLTGASMIVIKDGQAIYKKSFGDYRNIAPRVAIASASKWLSALVIQRLVDSGSMRWGDTVADYFGNDYPNASLVKGSITLRQLFTHTSGMSVEPATCLQVEYKNMVLDDCAKTILSKQLSWMPGTLFAYGENSMQVAGAMAQRATGKTWAQLVETELTGPLGMTRTDFGVTERGTPFKNPTVAGGARSTMMDYAKVVQMVLQRGLFEGTQYLSPDSLAAMQRDQTGGVPTDPDADPFPDSFGYGFGEWRNLVDCNGTAIEISATGVYGPTGWVNHEQGIAAVFLSWRQVPGGDILRSKITQLWALVRDVINEPPQCPGQ
jgi:CubicO group peptidase (beta-lactamase class C family)